MEEILVCLPSSLKQTGRVYNPLSRLWSTDVKSCVETRFPFQSPWEETKTTRRDLRSQVALTFCLENFGIDWSFSSISPHMFNSKRSTSLQCFAIDTLMHTIKRIEIVATLFAKFHHYNCCNNLLYILITCQCWRISLPLFCRQNKSSLRLCWKCNA